MADSADPDKKSILGAAWFGLKLFAQTYLSESELYSDRKNP